MTFTTPILLKPRKFYDLFIYLHYFGKEDETKYGVVSFELEIIN